MAQDLVTASIAAWVPQSAAPIHEELRDRSLRPRRAYKQRLHGLWGEGAS